MGMLPRIDTPSHLEQSPVQHAHPSPAVSKLEHEPCLPTTLWHARCISSSETPKGTYLHRRRRRTSGVEATEDPPFGGLWCDQPAIFLRGTFLVRLAAPTPVVHIGAMDGTQLAGIHQALVAVQHAVTSMTFSNCD